MKNFKFKYLAMALMGLAGLGAVSCQDHFDDMPGNGDPVASIQANMTIAEFKAYSDSAFTTWHDNEDNYCIEIPSRADGSHFIIKGRVISSDYNGNIFKCLYIQDETAALPMSINQYNLYMTNRIGQEIVIDLTGMYVGKYAGMLQLGFPSWYDRGNCWQTSFMAPEVFTLHREYNGNPEPAKIDTITVQNASEIAGSSPAELQKWQGQLVRFNNAKFVNGGTGATLCAAYQTSVSDEQNQTLNITGGSIVVRTSGYAKFWNTPLPAEACDVVGLLGYYNGTWQLLLNDADGIMNVGNPTEEGSKSQPYSVEQAIAFANSGTTTTGWVKGYIVGTVAPEVTEVTSNEDITWVAPFIMDNTLVIAPEPDCRDIARCIILPLAEDSKLHEVANLADNPDVLGKTIAVQGRFEKYMSQAGIGGNNGSASQFQLEGVDIPSDEPQEGNGTENAPYTVTQAIAQNNSGATAWVSGYIVGVINYDNNSNLETTTPTTVNTCIAIAATPDETDKSKCVAVQLPVGDIRSALNLVDNPGNLGKVVTIQGSLEKYFGIAGLKSVTAYKLDGSSSGGGSGSGSDTPTPPAGGEGNGTQASPYNCAKVIALGNPGSKAWIEGYIIGVINYNNNSSLELGASTSVNTCIAIADSPTVTSKDDCVAVQLPIGDIRSALNLVDNPGIVGKKVKLEGSLEKYFGIAGLKSVTAYELDGSSSGGGSETPDVPATGGTEAAPYTVDQVLALNNPGTSAWTEGYIVGWTTNGTFAATFGAGDDANPANVLLAASATETDPAKCVPVQLSSGSEVRAALNLKDNPTMLGKKVALEGTLEAYFNRPGIKSVTSYKTL